MSDEIMFSDMLNHYSIKLNEISDMMTDLVGYVNKSVVLANESWSSISSEAFNEKITISQRYLREIDLSLDEMLKLLNSVKDNELNESIDELSANTDNACS